MPRELVKHFWMCLWDCFSKRLAFESLSWVMQVSTDYYSATWWVFTNPLMIQIEEKGRGNMTSYFASCSCPHPSEPLVFRPSRTQVNYTSGFTGSLVTEGRVWYLWDLTGTWSNSCNKSFHTSISIAYWLFRKTLIHTQLSLSLP